MSKIAVANANATFTSSRGGSVSVTTAPSSTTRYGGGAVYRGSVSVTVEAGASSGDCTQTVPASGNIEPTAEKMRVDGENPLREGDSVDINVTGQDPGANPCSFTTTVEVTDAGQHEVRTA